MLNLSDIRSLVNHTESPTLTLYLAIDPALPENQAAQPAWRIAAKNDLNSLNHSTGADQQAVLATLRAQIEQYLEHDAPTCKGLALFYTPSHRHVYELPVPVEHQAAFGRPLIAPLLAMSSDHRIYLLVTVDHAQANFYTITAGRIELQDTLDLSVNTSEWRTKTAMPSVHGVGRGNKTGEFNDRMEEEMTRQYQKVAVRLGHLMHEHKASAILLGGDEQAAHSVHTLLPSLYKDIALDVVALPRRLTPTELLDRVRTVLADFEARHDLEQVNHIIDTAKARGRGALGTVAVEHVLERGQVETLYLPEPTLNDQPMQTLALDALTRGAEVVIVRGAAAEQLAQEGGVAARLYYAA